MPAAAQTNLPTLHLTASNGVTFIRWPLNASNYILQATAELSSTPTWTNLVTGSQFVSLSTFPASGGSAIFTTNSFAAETSFEIERTNPQQFFRLATGSRIPACCFAIFYNDILEFTQCPAMIINGRAHANGPIYVGTSAALTFNQTVSTTTALSAPYLDGFTGVWTPSVPNTWNITFNNTPDLITNSPSVGITGLNLTNYHALIDIPPNAELATSALGQLRLYNQAQLVLLVTNDVGGGTNLTVRLTIQAGANGAVPGADPAKVILNITNAFFSRLSTNLPFLNLTNIFYDRRESKTNLTTEIDLGQLADWLNTNSLVQEKLPAAAGVYPTIFYVADRRNVNAKQLAVVRLRNGTQLPSGGGRGFTIATANPLYVVGDYNVAIAGETNQSLGTTNTAYTVPAALISDALTVLSSHWSDTVSFTTYSGAVTGYKANSTTINAAIIAGNMTTTGTSDTTFSGGVHNFPRLLENWNAQILWLNTSMIRLWNSNKATNQFRNPDGFLPAPVNPYYNPPTRRWAYDINLLVPLKIPPGMPLLEILP